jgi:O-antigen ligase
MKKIELAGLLLFLSICGYLDGYQENVALQSIPIWLLAITLNIFAFLNSEKSFKVSLLTFTCITTTLILTIFMGLSTLHGNGPLTERILGSSQRGDGLATYISLIYVFVGVLQLDLKSRVRLIDWIIYAGIFQSGISILQKFGFEIFNPKSYDGVTGTLSNTNTAGFLFALLSTFCLSKAMDFTSESKARVYQFLLFAVFSLQAIFTKTIQGPVLLLLGIFGVMAMMLYSRIEGSKYHAKRITVTSINVVVVLFSIFLIYPKLLGIETFKIRTYYWQSAWNMFLENPILGVGPGSFASNVSKYRELDYVKAIGHNLRVDDAHNLYLHTLSTLGFVVAMTIFLGVLVILVSSARKSRTPIQNASLLAVIVFLVGALISYFSTELIVVFVVLLAMLCNPQENEKKPRLLKSSPIVAVLLVTTLSIIAVANINQTSIPTSITKREAKILLLDQSLRCEHRTQLLSEIIGGGVSLSESEIEDAYLADLNCLSIGIAIARRDVLENRASANAALSRVFVRDPNNPILIGLRALLFDSLGKFELANVLILRANSIKDLTTLGDPELQQRFLELYSKRA